MVISPTKIFLQLSWFFKIHLFQSLKFVLVLMLFWTLKNCSAATCSASASYPSMITSNEFSYTGYTTSYNYGLKVGRVSNSFYYFHYLSPPDHTAVRRVNPDESLVWLASIDFDPLLKSFSLDFNEQNVYFGRFSNPLSVVRLLASTGAIVDAQKL